MKTAEITKDALLEIGTEEIPARFVSPALQQLSTLIADGLTAAGCQFQKVETWGTPRRLVAYVHGLSSKTKDRSDVVIGPPPKVAKDTEGKWTQAALSFAKTQGVSLEKLVFQQTAKGERLVAIHHVKGQSADQVLKDLFPRAIQSLNFPKTMVWEESGFRFARPLRWIVALYNSKVIRFKIAGVQSDRTTVGLLALGGRKISIPKPEKYKSLLQGRCILICPSERANHITKQMDVIAKKLNATPVYTPEHLEEVVQLTEYPVSIHAQFKDSYLRLPREVLTSALVKHQRFFPLENSKGQLTQNFVGVRNGPSEAQEGVRDGYQRVINARLSDAQFFFDHDVKTRLEDLAPKLAGVGFIEKVGTLWDKTVRVRSLVKSLGEKLSIQSATLEKADRVALLAKADLLTLMVGEFPELQGVAGRFYAATQESSEIGEAIEQHYWPLTTDGKLPATEVASLVALADKLDTLAANFSVGLVPSGSADPNGLRRLGAGVIRILMKEKWDLPLEKLLPMAFENLPAGLNQPAAQSALKEFLIQRCANWLAQQGYRNDEIDAVLSADGQKISTVVEKLEGLKSVRGRPEFGSLAAAIKRARNILRQAKEQGFVPSADALQLSDFQEKTEQSLYQFLTDIRPKVQSAVSNREFKNALIELAPLKEPVDAFFDGVMVMVDDERVRSQRLKLLMQVKDLFDSLADFSKLQTSN